MNLSLHGTLMTLAFGIMLGHASLVTGSDSTDRWQLKRLFSPTPAQLRSEEQGRIFIYDGLKDTEVSRALDEEFPRIEYMMFTSTVVTDRRGDARVDPQTGSVVVEEDGCD